MDKKLFKHEVEVRVRTFDVDSQGIVHNSNYLKYFEIGRVEYWRSYGYRLDHTGQFSDGLKVVVVHNSIDYLTPAYLDEVLLVLTRISWIKNSSICFENLILKKETLQEVCNGKGILVNIDDSNVPIPIPQTFVDEMKNFEGENLKLIK